MRPSPVTLDIAGLELSMQDCRRIMDPLTGGVILFSRNFANCEQLTKLTTEIKKLRSDVLISIDHEGGRVQRCRTDGFTHLPAMRKLGELWMAKSKSPHFATSAVQAMTVATACGYVLQH